MSSNSNQKKKEAPISQTPQPEDLKKDIKNTSGNKEAGSKKGEGILQEEKESAKNSK